MENNREEDLLVLNTIYDEVEAIDDGIYAIKSKGKYGLVDKNNGITINTIYKDAIYRDKYTYFKEDSEEGLLVLTNEISNMIHLEQGETIEEYNGLQYRIVGIVIKEKEGIKRVIIDTRNGDELLRYGEESKVRYRPYNSEIVIAVLKDKEYIGITRNLEVGNIENLVQKLYTNVNVVGNGIRRRYSCKDRNGQEIELNAHGQLY